LANLANNDSVVGPVVGHNEKATSPGREMPLKGSGNADITEYLKKILVLKRFWVIFERPELGCSQLTSSNYRQTCYDFLACLFVHINQEACLNK
jgi:hypothetical protein